ncbi:MAG: DUF5677 domain-containing protein [Saccharofermentans sp.]|nr:DUF5677 domain-containing protein [Saccharofermentans sp.]
MEELEENKTWIYGRLPEYLWIALIFDAYGRKDSFRRLSSIIHEIRNKTSIKHIRFSDFLLAKEEERQIVYASIKNNVDFEIVSPLTAVITCDIDSLFAREFSSKLSIEDRVNRIKSCLEKFRDHQSFMATDVRYIVLVYDLLGGKIVLDKSTSEFLYKYQLLDHSNEEMRMIRPLVRSTEITVLSLDDANEKYLNLFWDVISKLTECDLYIMFNDEEKANTEEYYFAVQQIFIYLQQLYMTCSPLDKKMKVLLGIATYSYKRLEELEKHKLYNSISGRTITRCLIENYIMMKYLALCENEQPTIWDDYETYGIGQYKLVLARYREASNTRDTHINVNMIDAIVNEYKNEEFQDMDTNYFNKDRIREKAIKVNERDLFGLYYDYDSAFEPGLWGAIRETSFLKCDNPAHQYHCVPNINEDITLKSVYYDCVYIMNKTISFLDDLYGVPKGLLGVLKQYEQ